MDNKTFEKIVDDLTNKVKATLIKKTDEYNLDEDRLKFFKKGCILLNEEPHQTLLGYVNKQIVSEFDMGASNKIFTEKLWLEKILDIVCYQYLLYAVLKDTNKFENDYNRSKTDESSR